MLLITALELFFFFSWLLLLLFYDGGLPFEPPPILSTASQILGGCAHRSIPTFARFFGKKKDLHPSLITLGWWFCKWLVLLVGSVAVEHSGRWLVLCVFFWVCGKMFIWCVTFWLIAVMGLFFIFFIFLCTLVKTALRQNLWTKTTSPNFGLSINLDTTYCRALPLQLYRLYNHHFHHARVHPPLS